MVKNNTLIYLDWDDTLFPTTWYHHKNKNTDAELSLFDNSAHDFILLLQGYGDIIIITNAAMSWISEAKNLLEKTCKILDKIEIISARDKYSKYSDNPADWKQLAFEHSVNSHNANSIFSVISIGDSDQERQAVMNLQYTIHGDTNIKSIKLIPGVCAKMISGQYTILKKMMGLVCKIDMDLDIDMNNYVKNVTT